MDLTAESAEQFLRERTNYHWHIVTPTDPAVEWEIVSGSLHLQKKRNGLFALFEARLPRWLLIGEESTEFKDVARCA